MVADAGHCCCRQWLFPASGEHVVLSRRRQVAQSSEAEWAQTSTLRLQRRRFKRHVTTAIGLVFLRDYFRGTPLLKMRSSYSRPRIKPFFGYRLRWKPTLKLRSFRNKCNKFCATTVLVCYVYSLFGELRQFYTEINYVTLCSVYFTCKFNCVNFSCHFSLLLVYSISHSMCVWHNIKL